MKIELDEKQLETAKKFFLIIVCVVQQYQIQMLFNYLMTEKKEHLNDTREQGLIYKNGFEETNKTLQTIIRYENTHIDSIADSKH